MKKERKSRGIPFDEIRLKMFKDPKQANYAVKLALQAFEKDNHLEILLDTLRLVARAQKGGSAALARKTSVSKLASEALSQGNPRLRTFQRVLGNLGLRLSVKPALR